MKTRVINCYSNDDDNNDNNDKIFLDNDNLQKLDNDTFMDWASECEYDICLDIHADDKEKQKDIYEYYNNIYNRIPESIRLKLESEEWYVHLTKRNSEWICFQHLKNHSPKNHNESKILSLIIDITNDKFCFYEWNMDYLENNLIWENGIENNLYEKI